MIFCTKTGSKDGQINPSWMEHAAILYTDKPFHKVFREFLDIFDKYYAWYEQCLKIIIENKDVSDLLDYATTFLCNPIALFSPTGKLLHYTGKFQEKSRELSGTRLSISALHRQNPYILTNSK